MRQWNAEFLSALDAFGTDLWKKLPDTFKTEYFRLIDRPHPPQSIMIHSDEMIFPWELVVPFRVSKKKLEKLEPLGVRHVMGRWKPGLGILPEPQDFQVKKLCVLNPTYEGDARLSWSESEAKMLRDLFPGASVVKPATMKDVNKQLLGRSDIHMVHFSGHGDYDPADASLSCLLLEGGGTLPAITLTATELGVNAHPFFYMNACSVGQTGLAVGRMGGFAATCVEGGFSGVIAPYWPIDDQSAMNFASALYHKLKNGIYVGEALQQLRDASRGDPTAAAFTFLGDPWARLQFA